MMVNFTVVLILAFPGRVSYNFGGIGFRSLDLIKNLALCEHPDSLNNSNVCPAEIDLGVMTPDVDKKKSNRGQAGLA